MLTTIEMLAIAFVFPWAMYMLVLMMIVVEWLCE